TELSTGAYGLRPVYASQRDGGEPRITGYQASNIVHVKTRELARVGEIIDAALLAGANQVQRIGFTLSNETVPREEALRTAAAKARREAGAIATA
ncbi:SIMPL domain-containing protein, partial [Escherichia coli]|uniref:SIMPL domain-containing protein n=1 Tax=Escherichia coli TaxID=562 RepID=UPI002113B69B